MAVLATVAFIVGGVSQKRPTIVGWLRQPPTGILCHGGRKMTSRH
jgi:hypothetical protein